MSRDRDLERWCNDMTNHVNELGQHAQRFQRFQNQYEIDKQIEAVQQLNEKLVSSAINYTNLILAAGYAGFFAFWTTLSERLPTWIYSLAGLFILVSLVLFIVWELIKMIWGSFHMRRVSKLLAGQKGPSVIAQYEVAHARFQGQTNAVWVFFLIPTVITGVGAAFLLIGYFAFDLWKQVFS